MAAECVSSSRCCLCVALFVVVCSNQMIMGMGKTTVVGPLLALLLADGRSLVLQVVPRALLEFSRSVMRSRFSAITRKHIYTFGFDRFSDISAGLYHKFVKARANKAIIMTTPNALKSFALKFVETLHNLDLLVHSQQPEQNVVKSFFGRALGLGGRSTAADDTAVRIRDLQQQAQQAVRILNLWQGSHLLMDEVDVILHPSVHLLTQRSAASRFRSQLRAH